jgi:hypothetical protein
VIDELTFRQAVWLFCPAFMLHVLEEWPRFTGWARLHASPRFTQRDYNVIHSAIIQSSPATPPNSECLGGRAV